MNSFAVVVLASLAVANAVPSGLLLGAGLLAPRHNQWGDIGPSGIVTGAGSQSAAGIVTGAGAVGPSGIVTGHGAVGPNGIPSTIRDDGIIGLAPRVIAPVIAPASIAVASPQIASVGIAPLSLGLGVNNLGLGINTIGLGLNTLRRDAIIGPAASSVVVSSGLEISGHGW